MVYSGVINVKTSKTAALPKFSYIYVNPTSIRVWADYAHQLGLSHLNISVITPLIYKLISTANPAL